MGVAAAVTALLSVAVTMGPIPPRTVQIEAKILGARGLVSTKGEETISSSASLSLLGLDAVESELVCDQEPGDQRGSLFLDHSSLESRGRGCL